MKLGRPVFLSRVEMKHSHSAGVNGAPSSRFPPSAAAVHNPPGGSAAVGEEVVCATCRGRLPKYRSKYCSKACFRTDKERPIVERFWAKVRKSEPGCWEYRGSGPDGYGRIDRVLAHRFSWELHFGAIPAGMMVCHHCDNRKCVRPDHLFVGSNRDNMLDASGKGRLGTPGINRGEKQHLSRLTGAAVDAIRERCRRGEKQRRLAAEYGVSQSSISLVCTRRTWGWR